MHVIVITMPFWNPRYQLSPNAKIWWNIRVSCRSQTEYSQTQAERKCQKRHPTDIIENKHNDTHDFNAKHHDVDDSHDGINGNGSGNRL